MRALLFDLDDTLYPRDTFVDSGFAAVSEYVAAHWSCSAPELLETLRSARRSARGREFQALCRSHELPSDILPTLIDVFRRHRPAIALPADVRGMLHRARCDGWRLGIITNGDPAVQKQKVSALELSRLCDCVVYAEEHVAGGKPHPFAFHAALRALDLSASAAVMAGDDPLRDTRGARLAGVHAIEVTAFRGSARNALEETIRPDATVDSVLDVPTVAACLLQESARAV
jgi:HAD superfamily hydrolase (TIGR01509 family)